MIRGYPERPSVSPGQQLTLCVSTDAPRFKVAFHRWGADGFVSMSETGWLAGAPVPDGLPQADWQWPPYAFDIPRHWPSGVYVAHLIESEQPQPLAVWMDQAAALFIVRGPGKAPILYKLPLATYHAYNVSGGACFYFQPPQTREDPPGAKLSWHRPGGGIGGLTFGAPDHYDTASPRQTFAHWDAVMIRWLLREGFELEFCADVDVHHDPERLARHRLVMSAGHDEYWTDAMRDHVQAYAEQGGHVAFFGGNTCWWRIHLIEGDTAMVCHQGGPKGALDHWWPPNGVHRPEDRLSGVSYRHGGGWWDGLRHAEPMVVHDGGHWVFEGTGLARGDRFGHTSTPPLVGYECDGAPLEWLDEARGLAQLDPRAAECGTPPGLQLLAVAKLEPLWQELPHREHHPAWQGLHNCTMALHPRGRGWVFSASTTDWAQVVANGSDPHVATITRNVLRRALLA